MNAQESLVYWQKRWEKQGPATVGHAGDTDAAYGAQTMLYGTALQGGLRRDKPEGYRYPRLLDYGCGWGRMLDYLRPLTDYYTGVDIAAAGVDIAIKRWPDLFSVLQYPEIEQCLLPKKYHAVVCCTVLQHIVDPAQFERTCKALRATLTARSRVVLLENISELSDKPHIVYRTVGEYESMFPGLCWSKTDVEVVHRGETHALMVGDLA